MQYLAYFLLSEPDPEAVKAILLTMAVLIPIFIIVAIAIVMVPCWFILKKAGFSPWLALLCIIPSLGTLVLLYVLAFSDWKVVPAPQPVWQQPPQPPYPPQA
jgi:hypothetical protein